MPYPNEHAARLKAPGQFKEFNRKNDEGGEGVDFIYGIKDGKATLQAIRFDRKKFTPAQARMWLKEHDHKPMAFEQAAEKVRKDKEPEAEETWLEIVKEHPDYTFVLAPALVPEVPDHQGDIVSADEIELAAHGYMIDSQAGGFMHRALLDKASVVLVESYITRASVSINGRKIPKGTWVTGWRVYDAHLRQLIREGKLGGISIGGAGQAA